MEVTGMDDDNVGGTGYSVEDLSAYLDRGRTPRIAAIESSAPCRAVLTSMERMAQLSRDLVATEADRPLAESWYDGIMREVAREFRAGRDIPLAPEVEGVELVATEGALHELVRTVGDAVPGILIGRVHLRPTEDASVHDILVSISVRFGRRIGAVVHEVRTAVRDALERQGGLRVGTVDVTVDDVHVEGDEA
jgi:uncharacterized alkaline shock family protein YloU